MPPSSGDLGKDARASASSAVRSLGESVGVALGWCCCMGSVVCVPRRGFCGRWPGWAADRCSCLFVLGRRSGGGCSAVDS
eukprot:8936002-Prorocentrum_lima.AAC.1